MGAGFNPEVSGAENILLNGAMLGFRRREMQEKIEGIYEFTGLREFADLPLKYYSSGMYMRLAFAIATEVDPTSSCIDEALGAGDAAFLDKAKAPDCDPPRPYEGRRHRLARHDAAARDVHPGRLDAQGTGRRPTGRSTRSSTATSRRRGRAETG